MVFNLIRITTQKCVKTQNVESKNIKKVQETFKKKCTISLIQLIINESVPIQNGTQGQPIPLLIPIRNQWWRCRLPVAVNFHRFVVIAIAKYLLQLLQGELKSGRRYCQETWQFADLGSIVGGRGVVCERRRRARCLEPKRRRRQMKVNI